MRIGGTSATPATLGPGGTPPFALPDPGKLLFTLDGNDDDVTLSATAAAVTAQQPLAGAPINLANDTTLTVTFEDGVEQSAVVHAGPYTHAALAVALNAGLRGGHVALDANKLVLTSDGRGTGSRVSVKASADLGFDADIQQNGAGDVVSLRQVTVAELNALLNGKGVEATTDAAGKLLLRTTATGANKTLVLRDDPTAIHGALGLAVGPAAQGTEGNQTRYALLKSGDWLVNGLGDPLNLADLEGNTLDLLSLNVLATDADGSIHVVEGAAFDPTHPQWLGHRMPARPDRLGDRLRNLYRVEVAAGVDGVALRALLFSGGDDPVLRLSRGSDGAEPIAAAYTQEAAANTPEGGLKALQRVDDISIVATPGASAYAEGQAIANALITHVDTQSRYRIAVLDAPPNYEPQEIKEHRGKFDSIRAALYYPWITAPNPLARPGVRQPREINLPPSGYICGIYARNDNERGVWKAPANEIVLGALRFERNLSHGEQEALNPFGVNCLRSLTGRGNRVWGARLISSDPEWKYVSDRRYFNYLEASIDRSMQWVVFEPNGERLWANVREALDAFLYNEWRGGALLGASRKEAYFVRCDRSTMTQNDLDNGRLVCEIGVAIIRPAEFVIFRIGQKTASARD
ncbi:MAG: phage tail sheath subtilisin-like domain-containing protein [Alphaproteobacteria bacterium]|nr:phage tail sheath subtilisin-like domain-containing protein [Alphaproteobacteria bacterium]